MDVEFTTALHKQLGDSKIQINTLTDTLVGEADLQQRAINQRRLEAHRERAKCIETLLRVESLLDELDYGQ